MEAKEIWTLRLRQNILDEDNEPKIREMFLGKKDDRIHKNLAQIAPVDWTEVETSEDALEKLQWYTSYNKATNALNRMLYTMFMENRGKTPKKGMYGFWDVQKMTVRVDNGNA